MGRFFRKKYSIGVIVCIILMSLSQVSFADVIYEPNDDFYTKHRNECDYISRSYIVNGQKGSANLYLSPVSDKVVTKLINKILVYISFTYPDKNGVLWGSIELFDEIHTDKLKYHGWIKMKDVQPEYDNQAFCEEHEKEFKKYNGELDNYVIKNPIVLWRYPGSEIRRGKLNEFDSLHTIVYTYKDSNNRLWGYYAFKDADNRKNQWGYSALWICISDPTNIHLPVIDYPQPTIIPPTTEAVGQGVKVDHASTLLLIAIPVVVLVVITGLLIKLFWKKV